MLGQIYSQIRNHKARGSSYPDTFLRLVRKQFEARVAVPVLEALAAGEPPIVEEVWSRDEVEALWSRNTEGNPYGDNPLVILRVGTLLFLIDGHNRRRKWLDEDRKEFPVVILEVEDA